MAQERSLRTIALTHVGKSLRLELELELERLSLYGVL